MKRSISVLSIGLLLGLSACSLGRKAKLQGTNPLATHIDSVAYAFGLINGANFARLLQSVPGDSLSRKEILRGFTDQVEAKATQISVEQARTLFQSYLKELEEQDNKLRIAKNDSVLQANKLKEGVTTTESGLQYRILKQGTGAKVQALTDTVVVHYKGLLIDGTVFDSSYERGVPASFPVGQVIAGWTEVLQLMSVGAKYEVYIPSNLAYGEHGAGDAIPPYSALIFEVELLDVNKTQENKISEDGKPIESKKASQNKVKVSKSKR